MVAHLGREVLEVFFGQAGQDLVADLAEGVDIHLHQCLGSACRSKCVQVLRELREIDQEHLTEAMGLVPLHWQAQHVDADEVLVRRHAPQVEGFLANHLHQLGLLRFLGPGAKNIHPHCGTHQAT